MDKYLLTNYVLDYIPAKQLKSVSVQNVYDWSGFLYHHQVFEMKNIYEYLNHKLKEIEITNPEH